MAECTEYSSIVVSGAGTAVVNGTYVPYSTGSRPVGGIYTIWTKDGSNSYPRIEVDGSDPGQWSIRGIPFSTASIYNTPPGSFSTSDCPVGFEWSVATFGTAPAPTVTGVLAVTDPIAERNAKYATATEAGAVRFRRLAALGYV